jgi:hypothetical protein
MKHNVTAKASYWVGIYISSPTHFLADSKKSITLPFAGRSLDIHGATFESLYSR